MTTESKRPRALRVALVMGGSVIAERTLEDPVPVRLGYGDDASLPLPAGVTNAEELPFMEPTPDGGWEVVLHPKMKGAIWTAKGRLPVEGIRGERIKVGPTDYGVLTLGNAAYFFQRVDRTAKLGRGIWLDPNVLASVSVSTFLHAAALLLLFLAQRESPTETSLELSADLIRQFMVTPPPPDVEVSNASTGEEDLSELLERAEGGDEGEAMPEEGDSSSRSPRSAPRARPAGGPSDIGLIAALRGGPGQGSALSAALDHGPDIQGLVDGLREAGVHRTGGGRGYRLRGPGGGAGPGDLYRAGSLDGLGGPGGRRRRVGARPQPRRPPPREVIVEGPRSPIPEPGSGYPASAIQRVVMRHRSQIRYCYDNEVQRRRDLRGRVEVSWRIERDGRVSGARIARSTLGSSRVEGCILRQIRRWEFRPPTGNPVRVNYPFILGIAG